MKLRPLTLALATFAACLVTAACNAPGKPKLETEARPDDLADFSTLYKENCSACHGNQGKGGAAISLANPVYLATAGVDNIKRIASAGVAGTAMPPFASSAGGMLTDRQITILSEGIVHTWGASSSGPLLPYSATLTGNAANGHTAFTSFCAQCHGADGTGVKASHMGSIVDPSYLALITDQNLRSTIIAGRPDLGMPDWRSHVMATNQRAMTDQEVTDIVAWIVSHRVAAPGQPYAQ
jgi:mono/diheme cytochrome c family protein